MNKSGSNSKFFSILLIISSLTGLGIWIRYELPSEVLHTGKPPVRTQKAVKAPLQKIWEDDIKNMVSEKLFDKEITSLYKVRVFLLDQNLHEHFKGLKAPFKFNRKGLNLLEVSFMSHYSELEKQNKLIIQYNLVNRESGNMFWEHSRTVLLPEGFVKP